MRINKNYLLLSTYIISLIPTIFFDSEKELRIGIFTDRTISADWFATFYCVLIDFLIMAYCLHYPKGIDRRVSRLILIITILDFLHLLLFAMQGLGVVKIGFAMTILIGYELYKKYAND